MTYKNFYTATEIQPGDEFVVTFKVMIQYNYTARGYRCGWNGKEHEVVNARGLPEGEQMLPESTEAAMKALMPTIHYAVYGEDE